MGGSAHGVEKGGLTELGKKAVQQMEALQMIIDLSHASPTLIDEVLEMTSRPVMVSHTGVKGCLNNSRNLSDEQLKEFAFRGGLIGISFCEEAVGKEGVKELPYKDISLYVSRVMDFKDQVVAVQLTKKMLLKDLELPTLKLM